MKSGWADNSIGVAGHDSDCGGTVAVVGKGVVGGVASGTGVGVGSGVPSVVGSLMGGAEAATTGSFCGLGAASSRGLSCSSTVSTDCHPVACLSASLSWS